MNLLSIRNRLRGVDGCDVTMSWHTPGYTSSSLQQGDKLNHLMSVDEHDFWDSHVKSFFNSATTVHGNK